MDQGRYSEFNRINFMLMSIAKLYHDAIVRFGLSENTGLILRFLSEFGGSCPLSAIYKTMGIRKQTVNSAIRKLEADGIVYLEQDTGRSKRVVLTESGRELAEKTVAQIHSAEVHVLDDWTQEEIQTYILLLTKIASSTQRELDKLDYPD